MATKKSKQKNKTFGEKLFGRFSKKKATKDKDKHKKEKKENKRNGKTKYAQRSGKYDKRSNYNTSKPHKIIDVTPAVPTELKDTYTVDDVIHYRSQVIRSVNDKKRKTLVTEKLRLCSVRFDFTQIMDPSSNNNPAQQLQSDKRKMDGIPLAANGMRPSRTLSKEEMDRRKELTIGIDKKRQMLVEIVEFISTQKWWDEDILKELIHCVTSNLFRTLPLGSKRKFVKGDEEEEPFLDPQWLHLQLVYELCLRFLISNDIDKKVMQKYLHGSFVLNVIQLFQSEDLRERDYLKTILHRIYGRFMPLRQQIRTEIANECFRYVYGESRGVHGIAEFLDIFSSIINGFSIPVKEEHKRFLRNVLLPLHKCDKYEVYFQQLADCCVLFVNKEQSIATTVLAGLLKFWPKLSPTKQAFYLREMLNVIGALVEHENGFSYPKYKDIVLLCVDKIFESMESPHFQVADQALSLWKDTVMLYLSKCQKDMIWRRLFIIFKDIQLNHWNSGIKHLSNEVILYYEHIDFAYWKKLKDEYEKTAKTTANGSEPTDTQSNGNGKGTRHSNHKIPVVVPNTLVPERYQHAKQHVVDEKQKERTSKWKLIRETAQQNKQIMDKIKMIEMNGYIETPAVDADHDQEYTIKPLLLDIDTSNQDPNATNTATVDTADADINIESKAEPEEVAIQDSNEAMDEDNNIEKDADVKIDSAESTEVNTEQKANTENTEKEETDHQISAESTTNTENNESEEKSVKSEEPVVDEKDVNESEDQTQETTADIKSEEPPNDDKAPEPEEPPNDDNASTEDNEKEDVNIKSEETDTKSEETDIKSEEVENEDEDKNVKSEEPVPVESNDTNESGDTNIKPDATEIDIQLEEAVESNGGNDDDNKTTETDNGTASQETETETDTQPEEPANDINDDMKTTEDIEQGNEDKTIEPEVTETDIKSEDAVDNNDSNEREDKNIALQETKPDIQLEEDTNDNNETSNGNDSQHDAT